MRNCCRLCDEDKEIMPQNRHKDHNYLFGFWEFGRKIIDLALQNIEFMLDGSI